MQWVRVFVCSKQLLKDRTGSSQDHLLTILTGQSHISKVIVLSQVSKCTFDVVLEVVPLEAKFFRHFDSVCRIEYSKGVDHNVASLKSAKMCL